MLQAYRNNSPLNRNFGTLFVWLDALPLHHRNKVKLKKSKDYDKEDG